MSYLKPPNRLPNPVESEQLAARGARFEVVIDAALGVSASPSHWTLRPRAPLGRLPQHRNPSSEASLMAMLAIDNLKPVAARGLPAIRRVIRLCALSARGDAQAAMRAHTSTTLAEILGETFQDDEPRRLEQALVGHLHTGRLSITPGPNSLHTHLIQALAVHPAHVVGTAPSVSTAHLIAYLVAHAIDWSRHHDLSSRGVSR